MVVFYKAHQWSSLEWSKYSLRSAYLLSTAAFSLSFFYEVWL